jgi:hypothetical protein
MLLSPVRLHDALVRMRARLYNLYVSINDLGVADTIYSEINYLDHMINQVKMFIR